MEKTTLVKTRLFGLYVFFLIFAAAITVRLFSLQIVSHGFYQQLAENQHLQDQVLLPTRGTINAQEGRDGKTVPVVTNIEQDLVYAVPPEITDKQKTANVLAPVLGLTKQEILQDISDPSRKWVAVKKQLQESESLTVKKLRLPGIYLQPDTYRTYPEGQFASQVLGFLGYKGDQRVGQYGIEEYFNNLLTGKAGSLIQDKDLAGRWITAGLRKLQPVQNGTDVVLTIDRAVQYKAEQILQTTVDSFQADSGSMIVMNPKTGAIMAMANYPSYDPNNFNKVTDPAVYRNLAVSGAYEPGSIFKAITMAAGLEDGAVTPDMTYVDSGSVALDGFIIRNALNKVYGLADMTKVLQYSINTGAIFVEQKVGKEKFLDMVKRFGFGQLTGIQLPAEASGNIQNLEQGSDVNYATAAFGQGITVTPLQVVQAFAAIANQGKMMKPYIVQAIQNADGHTETTTPELVRQVMTPQTANTLGAMLVSVVELGHGEHAQVPGYYIAGKTGTAQVASSSGHGYDPNKNIGTFAGFGPVADPQFAIVVKVVNPKGVQFAETTAAPAFGQMAQYLVNYLQIPPTRPQ